MKTRVNVRKYVRKGKPVKNHKRRVKKKSLFSRRRDVGRPQGMTPVTTNIKWIEDNIKRNSDKLSEGEKMNFVHEMALIENQRKRGSRKKNLPPPIVRQVRLGDSKFIMVSDEKNLKKFNKVLGKPRSLALEAKEAILRDPYVLLGHGGFNQPDELDLELEAEMQ